MGRGFASESVIRDRLKRIEELKHELMDKKLLSRAHANAILNACIASSSFGGFELGMKIYEMLQTNFANLKRKAIENSSNKSSGLDDKLPVDMIVKNLSSAENSPPIPDMVTYSLMVRFLTKCKRSDLVKTVTQIDFVNSALIPDESFICSLLRHYLPLPGEENRALLLGYAASAFRLPILAEHIAGRHRRVLFQNRLYRILQKNAHSLVLTSKSLDILLRTTMKIPGRSVKLDVIKVLMERRALDEDTVDDAVARLVLGMHLKCSDYVGAQAFADFVLTFDEVKSDKSIGIYDDLISTMAVHLAQDNSLDSKFAPNYRELCNKLISICEQKRLIPSESSSAVDRVDISGLLQNPRLCLLRFLTNIQKFVVQCKALDKKDALSSEGFGKIFFVGLYFAEQYVPLCLEVVANQAGGADSWAFVDFLETSKEMLNLGQKLPEVSKNAKKFKFMKTGDPMQKRILKWGRMESDIEWVLQNRN
ncbi:hypothetical protein HDU84_000373 [Entophlyctis sp. JEL0112]|nr:hypothetical protein HDU84_000373 [Entophlyctis sp. JEL0112]